MEQNSGAQSRIVAPDSPPRCPARVSSLCSSCPLGVAPEGGQPLVADQEGTRATLPVPAPLSPVGETVFTGWAALEGETHRRVSQGAGPASPLVGDLWVWGGSVQRAGVLQLCGAPLFQAQPLPRRVAQGWPPSQQT